MTSCGLSTSGRCFLAASTREPLSYMGVIPITSRCECYLSAWTFCYLSARLFTLLASVATPIRGVARLGRNVGQPDHILANPVIGHKAERRPGSGEIWFAVAKDDGVKVDSILIDEAELGETVRQVRASNFDLPVALGLQLADRSLKINLNKPGVGADRPQRARDDPFRLVPPCRREGLFFCIPFRMIVVPVTHDFIHLATGDAARLPLSLLDETAEERGAWRKRHMVDVAVQGLVHSEHELSHTHFLSLRGTSAALCNRSQAR